MTIEPGFYENISNEDYHKSEGLSRSGMSRLLRSPAHFQTPVEVTPAMKFGTDVHTAILTPSIFDETYVTMPPDLTARSNAGKAFIAEAEANDQVIIKSDAKNDLEKMREAVYAHPMAKELLSDGVAELSGYAYDYENPEILVKIRIDYLNKGKRALVDLKTTTDARAWAFTKIAYDKDYDLEAAHYLLVTNLITGYEHNEFWFVVVETKAPYGVIVYKATDEFVASGLSKRSQAIQIYKECLEKDEWPCYTQEPQVLDLPAWKKRQEVTAIFE